MANSAYQEWLNRNAHRRFPLVENSDLTCEGGSFIPNDVILDARFCLFGLEDGPVLLRSVSVAPDGSCSMAVDLPGKPGVAIGGSGMWSDGSEYSARVVFGDPAGLSGYAGEYRLLKPVEFLRSRVMSVPYGIGADTLACGGVSAYGEIRVANGRNSTLGISGNDLVLDVGKGLGLGVLCPGDKGGYLCDGKVLYFINGQKADSDGNIDIMGGDGVSVSAGTYMGIPAVIVHTSSAVDGFAYK